MNTDSILHVLQVVSAALGALYALTVCLNAFNPLLAGRWPRLAAVLSGLGGHVAAARAGVADATVALRGVERLPAPPRAPILPVLCLALAALALGGCATARDVAVVTLDGAAEFATSAEPALEALDRRDQLLAIDAAAGKGDAEARLAPVRARYHRAWQAYRDYKASWLAAAAALRAYDDAVRAGGTHSDADVARAMTSLLAAEQALVAAVTAVRDGGAR